MIVKFDAKSAKALFRELPYFTINFLPIHGQFNNLLNLEMPARKLLERLTSIHDLDLFSLNDHNSDIDPNFNSLFRSVRCKYYSPNSFMQLVKGKNNSRSTRLSCFHTKIRSLKHHLDNFQTHLLMVGVTETRIRNQIIDFNPSIPNYNFEFVSTPLCAGGVGMYIDETLKYSVIERITNEAFQSLWLKIEFAKQSNVIYGVVCRYFLFNLT